VPDATSQHEQDRLRDANIATFHSVLQLMGTSQFAAACELMTEDVRCEWPYPPIPGLTERVGRTVMRDMFSARMGRMENFDFTVLATYELVEPDALVVEYESNTRRRDTGIPYGNRYIAVVRFREGKVSLWREYLNTLLVAELNPTEWGLPPGWHPGS
jgi:ketosteroid isomerase-like protein